MATKHILRQNSINCDKTDLRPHFSCEEILHMPDLSPHCSTWQIVANIYHVETSLQLITCHVEDFSTWQSAMWRKFLHMADLFPTGLWCLWQIWGMSRDDFLSLGTRMAHELSPFPTLGNRNEMLGFLGMIKNRTFDTQWVCDTFNVLLYSAVFGPCNKIFWKNATKKFQITSFMCKTIDEMYHIN